MNNVEAFYAMMSFLWREPSLILMLGKWRKGKTDTSLLLGHLGKMWGLLDTMASNIYTYNNPACRYITSMGGLKRWLHGDKLIKPYVPRTKLYIFDEALTHIPSRKAMSKKNVDVVSMIAELSKAHGRLIFCSQTDKVESTLKDSAFCRAVFYKVSKKIMTCKSPQFETMTFSGIPRSPIKFDADRLAEFSEIEGVAESDLSQEMKVATLYIQGLSMTQIGKKLEMFDMQVKRAIKKVLRAYVDKQHIQIVNTPK